MRPTLVDIRQSPLHAIAQANWLEGAGERKKTKKKTRSSDDVISDIYANHVAKTFDNGVLLTLEYLQCLEKYVCFFSVVPTCY